MKKADLIASNLVLPERFRGITPWTQQQVHDFGRAELVKFEAECREKLEKERVERGMRCVPEAYLDADFHKYIPENEDEKKIDVSGV